MLLASIGADWLGSYGPALIATAFVAVAVGFVAAALKDRTLLA